MAIDLRELLESYVERHNAGVRGGDFASLFELFAPDADLVFHGIVFHGMTDREFRRATCTPVELGPFHGDEIAAAFRRMPPDDELVLIGETFLAESHVLSAYGWSRTPDRRAGKLQIAGQRGRIVRLEIWADPS